MKDWKKYRKESLKEDLIIAEERSTLIFHVH